MDQRTFFREISALAAARQHRDALRLLRSAIGRRELDPEGLDKAGRRCQSLFTACGEPVASRVLILGQCTTSWLAPALVASAWADGRALEIREGEYDNVIQSLLSEETTPALPDVVVLLPWSQRLLSDGVHRSARDRVDEEVAFWRQAWGLIDKRLAARIVQVGYDWITPGPLGSALGAREDGPVGLVRAVNAKLRDALPAGSMFIDLEQISGELGRRRFYDARRYHWTKQPFSEEGMGRLAEHLAAAVRAVTTGPKKVLVLDLDNTLWGGVVGETGALGITLGEGPEGEAFTAFQKYVKGLADRGVVLAVCSKNNDADAREPFEKNPNMALSLDDVAAFEASWDPKASAIRRIAKTLQLGTDSFVFVDDNPAEREQVRQALPEVAVVDLPEDPAEFVRALSEGLWFEAVDLTDEDRLRAGQYRVERQRRDAEVAFESLDGYLTSLGMIADVRAVDETDLDRVVQLLGKTNQFNLTTRRHPAPKVRQMVTAPGAIALTLRLQDRFGDHGLVSVIIAVRDETDARTLHIDTWLMSCRVIGRTVEEYFFNGLVDLARTSGVDRIAGVYLPTAKNAIVEDLYDRLGFERRGITGQAGIEYQLDLSTARLANTFVQPHAIAVQETT